MQQIKKKSRYKELKGKPRKKCMEKKLEIG